MKEYETVLSQTGGEKTEVQGWWQLLAKKGTENDHWYKKGIVARPKNSLTHYSQEELEKIQS